MRRSLAVAAACLVALISAGPASGADPGRWTNTGVSRIPISYYQGVAADPAHNFYFDGIYSGLYKTDPALRQTAAKPEPAGVIPAGVRAGEQYNHIGDLAYDGGEGGRIILPMECYYPGTTGDANTCQNGAFGVADPATLNWRYYVKLDPAGIKKAMWVEPSPDGTLLWTSDGDDLVAYSAADVKPANAATPGSASSPKIAEVQRLRGAVPPAGITGAAFYDGRLYTAGQNGSLFQVWSTDLGTWNSTTQSGDQRLEIELPAGTVGESEGLVVNPSCGGVLHWIVTPFNTTGQLPTYGANGNAMLDFAPAGSSSTGRACRSSELGSSGGAASGPTGGKPPSPKAAVTTLRVGATRGMRAARKGKPFRIRVRAHGSSLNSVRLSLYDRKGKRVGRSSVFHMKHGRLDRPRIRVNRRLKRGRYRVVARGTTAGGTHVRGERRGIAIRRR